ncbi:unnamed protein product [Chilo suppressalis]|uniref:Chitin-binding type-2 domain-containing protein n=1 Tax=Chilo suppressalis TaxID=168631 RepID=A0ABN8L3T0_CHISP|nr:unnamed protein product [Chilo suppressalis]
MNFIKILGSASEVYSQVNCTATGAGRFPDPGDTTCKRYTFCVRDSATSTYQSYNYTCPTTSLFNPNTGVCTTNYVCNTTTTTTSSVCTTDGFVADPNSTDCTSYVQCVSVNGVFIETVLTCPTNTFYDPDTTLCELGYSCPGPTFSCTAAGRFANTADETCQSYFMCVLVTGTYVQYNYTCPTTSLFNPITRLCTISYTCT